MILQLRQSISAFISVCLLGLTACVTQPPEKEQVVKLTKDESSGQVVIHSTFGSSDIQNWRVIDRTHMVIETVSHGDLMATFSHPCSGLAFADTLGFTTMGPFQLDRTTSIILPDGRRCHFKSLESYLGEAAEDER